MSEKFSVIIVEDAKLELKGTEEIFRTEIQEADIIGVAMNEKELHECLIAMHKLRRRIILQFDGQSFL